MENALLCVLHAVLRSNAQIGSILRAARQLRPAGIAHSILLLCDLPDAGAAVLPGDAPMLRRLQSGIMAMNARCSGSFLLLVRKRVWDDAQRAYLGENQRTSCRQVIAQLLESSETNVLFETATISPASLKGRFSHVLFSDISLACTPDTPARMLKALQSASAGCVAASIREKRTFPQSALTRLCCGASFFLSPLLSADCSRLMRKGLSRPDAPVLYTTEALISLQDSPLRSVPAVKNCFFVRRYNRVLPDFFAAYRQHCLRSSILHALLPPFQMVLLLISAASGLPSLAALALIPPEVYALCHPRQLPGALLRLALLPVTACIALDTLLCRIFARSRVLRLRIPESMITPQGCMFFGAALLSCALYGTQALVILLPVSLLWLGAPLIIPALDAPTFERIPLHNDQRRQLQSLAESAFFDSENIETLPTLRMLTLCGGSMLNLLEPDEAARRIETQLHSLPQDVLPSWAFAAMLCTAQYLREHMKDCDAALRELPGRIESAALSKPLLNSTGKLSQLLRAARGDIPSSHAVKVHKSEIPEPLDLLFLPLESAKASPVYPLSLPLTHPHTFLRMQLLAKEQPVFLPKPASQFLFLSAAALDHPFFALLERSPVAGPYMPLLFV